MNRFPALAKTAQVEGSMYCSFMAFPSVEYMICTLAQNMIWRWRAVWWQKQLCSSRRGMERKAVWHKHNNVPYVWIQIIRNSLYSPQPSPPLPNVFQYFKDIDRHPLNRLFSKKKEIEPNNLANFGSILASSVDFSAKEGITELRIWPDGTAECWNHILTI